VANEDVDGAQPSRPDISALLSTPPEDRSIPALIIGEVAQAHDGSLGMAHSFIDAIADAGGDAVKFQTHIARAESTLHEPWRVEFSPQDETRYDYWKRMEFSEDQWRGLRRHANDRGLTFLSSPFSLEALELLEGLGVPAWKVASGEVSNPQLLDAMVATGKPILMSTGMSPLEEIDGAVERVRGGGVPFAVLQCTSAYPCPPDKVGLDLIPFFRERYGCSVGLSDHSGTIYPGLAAVTLGARIVEVHVALSRDMFGPDISASVSTDELRSLVEGIRFIEAMVAHPTDKDQLASDAAAVHQLFGKSVVAGSDLPAGIELTERHVAVKKPGTGIPAARLADVIGRTLRRDVRMDQLLDEDDLEPRR
jgi:N,N'-diacetyllegionaminate synthase